MHDPERFVIHAIIRTIRPVDRLGWEALWAGYNAFYGREGAAALPSGIVETTWCRLLDDRVPIAGLVAEIDGRLVGLAHVVFHPNLIQTEDTCYMQDLFTTPETRGRGVGRALVEGVCDLCRTRGAADVYWHTHKSNAAARKLYDGIAWDTDFVVYRTKPPEWGCGSRASGPNVST